MHTFCIHLTLKKIYSAFVYSFSIHFRCKHQIDGSFEANEVNKYIKNTFLYVITCAIERLIMRILKLSCTFKIIKNAKEINTKQSLQFN